ncbi:hypothetical protein BKA62DRAFT_32023 [Auriculariales sp. MPI-PUGE-AT-0066]|nr:hypothetical protein BKA62DRAFT_32023 [Auriculariales sp. MPI-PUGE-AT-0066]
MARSPAAPRVADGISPGAAYAAQTLPFVLIHAPFLGSTSSTPRCRTFPSLSASFASSPFPNTRTAPRLSSVSAQGLVSYPLLPSPSIASSLPCSHSSHAIIPFRTFVVARARLASFCDFRPWFVPLARIASILHQNSFSSCPISSVSHSPHVFRTPKSPPAGISPSPTFTIRLNSVLVVIQPSYSRTAHHCILVQFPASTFPPHPYPYPYPCFPCFASLFDSPCANLPCRNSTIADNVLSMAPHSTRVAVTTTHIQMKRALLQSSWWRIPTLLNLRIRSGCARMNFVLAKMVTLQVF